MTIRMTIMAPIARGLSSLLGGGNFLTGLIGGGSNSGISVPTNLGGGTYPTVDAFAGMFASGGFLGAGKWGIAGERGPEIVKGPAEIVPSTGGAVQLNYAPVLDMRGATGVTEGQVQSMLAQQFVVMKQTLPSMMRDAQQRRRI
jgi:hypothetical protein